MRTRFLVPRAWRFDPPAFVVVDAMLGEWE